MKKKIRIPIIPIILVIIAIIIVVVVINKNSKTSEEQLLQGEYDKLSSMQSYQFTKEKDSKNKTIVAKDGDKTAIDSYADGQHTTTVIKDNKTYYILHDKEEYYIYNSTNIENSIVIDWIKDVIGKVIIIHDMPDDFTTQPSGNPGTKIACGEIKKSF